MDPEVEKKLKEFEDRLHALEHANRKSAVAPPNAIQVGQVIALAWEIVSFIRQALTQKHQS